MADGLSRDDIITSYFHCGYSYKLILCFLFGLHGIHLSLRQLKRILRKLKLRRRHPFDLCVIDQSIRAIQTELHGSGSLLGYRAMCNRLRQQHGILVSRDDVMRIMSIMSPADVRMRRKHRLTRRVYNNKGPNYVWHIDGMDKLKIFGFAIHGCMDGYATAITKKYCTLF